MKKLVVLLLIIGVVYWWTLPQTVKGPRSVHEYEYIVRTSSSNSPDMLPMVIALHGNGDTPANFFETLLNKSDYPARYVMIKGPLDFGGGTAWPMDVTGLRDYGDALADALPVLLQRFPTAGRPVIIGFSGGAFMAYYLAAAHGELFSYILPLSGGLPSALVQKNRARNDNWAQVIAFHGTRDQVIGFGQGRAAVMNLRQQGVDAELIPFNGDHIDVFRSENSLILDRLRSVLTHLAP